MNKSTVFIVDDDKEVTESLLWLIESVGYQVEVFHNPQVFLERYEQRPGCLVLDVRMPEMSGLELQETLKEKNITLPIIFITGHGDIPMAVRAMKSGASEFLTKPVNNQILLETINKAIKFDHKLRESRLENAKLAARFERLTPREKEVMMLMVKGKLTKVIADKLGISPNTAELHRAKVMKKMEVKALAELVTLVVSTQLLDEELVIH